MRPSRTAPSRGLAVAMSLTLLPTLPLASATFPGCGAARAEGMPAFDRMVGGLGYAVVPETATKTAYFDTGAFAINYLFSEDRTVAVLSVSYAIKPEQAGRLPALDMLKANAELTSAFKIGGTADKPTNVELARYFPVAGLTPVTLRQQIDALVSNARDYMSLLDPDQWTPASASTGTR